MVRAKRRDHVESCLSIPSLHRDTVVLLISDKHSISAEAKQIGRDRQRRRAEQTTNIQLLRARPRDR